MLGGKPPRAPSGGSGNAREPPGPHDLLALRYAAVEPEAHLGTSGHACVEVLVEKVRELYVSFLFGNRGVDSWKSSVLDFKGSCIHTNVALDKSNRQNVEQWAEITDFITGLPCAWAAKFAAARVGRQFFISEWTNAGKKDVSVASSTGLKMTGGCLTYASEYRSLKSLSESLSIALGKPLEVLKEEQLSGTHLFRHFWAELSEMLSWGDEGDPLCDWATAKAPSGKQGGSTPSAAAGTRKTYYAPNAAYEKQVFCRRRAVAALTAALANFGVANVVASTVWREIFPIVPPECLREYYGPAYDVDKPHPIWSVPPISKKKVTFQKAKVPLLLMAPRPPGCECWLDSVGVVDRICEQCDSQLPSGRSAEMQKLVVAAAAGGRPKRGRES